MMEKIPKEMMTSTSEKPLEAENCFEIRIQQVERRAIFNYSYAEGKGI
jgi:hypothetical protein